MKTLIPFLILWPSAASLFVERPAAAEADVILHQNPASWRT